MKISKKFTLAFLLVIMLPMSILALTTTRMITASMEESAQEAINQNLKAAWIQYYVRGDQMRYGMLQAAAEHEVKKAVAERDRQKLKELMAAWKEYRPYVDVWAIVDREGVVIARLGDDKHGDAIFSRALISRAAKSGEAVVSTELVPKELLAREGLEVQNSEFGMMLLVVTPVIQGKEAAGVIITGDLLNGDAFVPKALEEKISGLIVSIVQGSKVISTNIEKAEAKEVRLSDEIIGRITSGLSFSGDAEIAAKHYKIAVEPIFDSEGEAIGALFVGVPKERFIALQSGNIKAIALVTLLGLLIASGIAVLIAGEISKPITKLAEATKRIREGDFQVQIQDMRMESRDEIGELATSFKTMAQRLQESYSELERIVDERTKELLLLQKVNNMLNSGAQSEEILRTIVDGLTSVFHYEICAVHLLDEEKKHLVCKSYSADSQLVKKVEELTGIKAINYKIPLYEGSILLRAIETKEPILTDDIVALVKSHTNSAALQMLVPAIAKLSGISHGIGVPLLAEDKIIGVIGVGSREVLNEKDVSRLLSFAKQAGLAVERAQMYKLLEHKVQERTKELKESKEFVDSILDSIAEIIYLRDPAYRVIKANKVAKQIVGKEVIGEHCYAAFMGGSLPCKGCPVERTMATGEIVTREVYNEKLKEHLLISTYPLSDENGELKAVVETIKVVTERRKLEQQLLQSEKLASIGRLAAGVAHEINNPLANISMYSQILLKTARAEKRNMLEVIKNQTDAAARIVKNLLEFSHYRELSFQPLDVNTALEKALTFLEHSINSSNVRVEKALAQNLPKVVGDENQLQQVFVNIITNGVQAMPDGGTLTIVTSSKNGWNEIKIADEGVGIPKEDLPKIFDPFFTTKEVGDGTGLGLFITYGIIQKHGGRINVESNVNAGTTFTIELPAREEQ